MAFEIVDYFLKLFLLLSVNHFSLFTFCSLDCSKTSSLAFMLLSIFYNVESTKFSSLDFHSFYSFHAVP